MNPADDLRDVPGSRHPDSDPVPGTIEFFYDSTWGEILLWIGSLGPALLWAIQFQTNYSLVEWACRHNFRSPLITINISFLIAALLCGALSWWNWARIGARWPRSEDEGIVARTRLIAILGILLTLIFGLLIVAQCVPIIVFHPCEMLHPCEP